ncbi:myocilin opposite strand protein [Sarcophilus harrisii]|uniref:myocilin opposite strand protein n=1 Tax=Sarcophilus harrisii TaxID=9305 RepID=UPI001301A446|nr:myocilin opposite strand protein [Sarcophilus harrisii]
MKAHPGLVQRCSFHETFHDLTLSPKPQLKDSAMTLRTLQELGSSHPSLAFQAGASPVVKSINILYKDLTMEVFKRRVTMSQRIMKLGFSSPSGTTSPILLVPPPPPPSPVEGYGNPCRLLKSPEISDT